MSVTRRHAVFGIAAVGFVIGCAAPAQGADRCAHARALEAAKYYAEAEKEYKKLLGVDSCATEQLVAKAHNAAKPSKPAPNSQLEEARRLQNAGFEADARKLVKSVAE